jgi:hypothetical protein
MFFTNSKDNKKDKGQIDRASVEVDGAGVVSVKSKEILRSKRGKIQLQAAKNVHLILKCG